MGLSYLARCVGQKKAREIWFLCRQYTAREAEEMGMVNKVVPFELLEDETVDWCKTIHEAESDGDSDDQAGLEC